MSTTYSLGYTVDPELETGQSPSVCWSRQGIVGFVQICWLQLHEQNDIYTQLCEIMYDCLFNHGKFLK